MGGTSFLWPSFVGLAAGAGPCTAERVAEVNEFFERPGVSEKIGSAARRLKQVSYA